jgi:DNA processing protein
VVDSGWVALSLIRHLGSKTLRHLLAEFDTTENILRAAPRDLMRVQGIGKVLANAIHTLELAQVERDIVRWQQSGIHIITRDHPDYPMPLTQLEDEPATLFVRGNLSQSLWSDAVAIIGTRQPTPKARELARTFGLRYGQNRYTVVSGLALGIDALAHEGALQSGGKTVAVLGSGVLNIYPHAHRALADRILEAGGALVCECSPDAEVAAPRLVARNRIITGLARLVVLVESSDTGGAMHAVKFARQQGKTLYTFDLPVTGNQSAIAQGVERVLRI